MLKIKLLFLLLPVTIFSSAQGISFNDPASDTHYVLTPKSPPFVTAAFLNRYNAISIDWNTSETSIYPLRLKTKNGWRLYNYNPEALHLAEDKSLKGFNVLFPIPVLENIGISMAERNGEYAFVHLYEGLIKSVWDTLIIENLAELNYVLDIKNHPEKTFDPSRLEESYSTVYNEETQELQPFVKDRNLRIIARNTNGWVRLTLRFTNTRTKLFQTSAVYPKRENLPPPTTLSTTALQQIKTLKVKFNVIDAKVLDHHGFNILGKNKRKGLWGFYAGEKIEEVIKPRYDTITPHFIQQEGVLEIWKNGKVGFINFEYDEVFEAEYDDFEYLFLDYRYGCALKRNIEWHLCDCYNGKKLIPESAENIDALIELWLGGD